MGDLPNSLLAKHHVLVSTDNAFQRRARLLQALWREECGLPIGERKPGVPLGSRLPNGFGKESRANLMTPAALAAARREVTAMHAGSGQKIDEDRLWTNLLSSQPLAFNLFSELSVDLERATRVLHRLWPERVSAVTKIAFEYSPGRSSLKYTADRTAFDVYVEHTTPGGGRGFIGIEVKYHEALGDKPAEHRPRYDEVTAAMGCFKPERLSGLRLKPVEQLWRDHMLAGSMLLDAAAGWDTGLYAFLYPEDNEACRGAAQLYRDHLAQARTFDAVTLEAVVAAIASETEAEWTRELRDRYLGWGKIDRLLSEPKPDRISSKGPLTPGHWTALRWFGSPEFARIKEVYDEVCGPGSVYFRVVDGVVNAIALHPLAPGYVGHRANHGDEGYKLRPGTPVPGLDAVRARHKAFEEWLPSVMRISLEEQAIIPWLRRALVGQLWLPELGPGWVFLNQEWRFLDDAGVGKKTDVLAVHLPTCTLGIVEAKSQLNQKAEAASQVTDYQRFWKRDCAELAPFFTKAMQAMGRLYDNAEAAQGTVSTAPSIAFFAAPDGDGLVVEPF